MSSSIPPNDSLKSQENTPLNTQPQKEEGKVPSSIAQKALATSKTESSSTMGGKKVLVARETLGQLTDKVIQTVLSDRTTKIAQIKILNDAITTRLNAPSTMLDRIKLQMGKILGVSDQEKAIRTLDTLFSTLNETEKKELAKVLGLDTYRKIAFSAPYRLGGDDARKASESFLLNPNKSEVLAFLDNNAFSLSSISDAAKNLSSISTDPEVKCQIALYLQHAINKKEANTGSQARVNKQELASAKGIKNDLIETLDFATLKKFSEGQGKLKLNAYSLFAEMTLKKGGNQAKALMIEFLKADDSKVNGKELLEGYLNVDKWDFKALTSSAKELLTHANPKETIDVLKNLNRATHRFPQSASANRSGFNEALKLISGQLDKITPEWAYENRKFLTDQIIIDVAKMKGNTAGLDFQFEVVNQFSNSMKGFINLARWNPSNINQNTLKEFRGELLAFQKLGVLVHFNNELQTNMLKFAVDFELDLKNDAKELTQMMNVLGIEGGEADKFMTAYRELVGKQIQQGEVSTETRQVKFVGRGDANTAHIDRKTGITSTTDRYETEKQIVREEAKEILSDWLNQNAENIFLEQIASINKDPKLTEAEKQAEIRLFTSIKEQYLDSKQKLEQLDATASDDLFALGKSRRDLSKKVQNGEDALRFIVENHESLKAQAQDEMLSKAGMMVSIPKISEVEGGFRKLANREVPASHNEIMNLANKYLQVMCLGGLKENIRLAKYEVYAVQNIFNEFLFSLSTEIHQAVGASDPYDINETVELLGKKFAEYMLQHNDYTMEFTQEEFRDFINTPGIKVKELSNLDPAFDKAVNALEEGGWEGTLPITIQTLYRSSKTPIDPATDKQLDGFAYQIEHNENSMFNNEDFKTTMQKYLNSVKQDAEIKEDNLDTYEI